MGSKRLLVWLHLVTFEREFLANPLVYLQQNMIVNAHFCQMLQNSVVATHIGVFIIVGP